MTRCKCASTRWCSQYTLAMPRNSERPATCHPIRTMGFFVPSGQRGLAAGSTSRRPETSKWQPPARVCPAVSLARHSVKSGWISWRGSAHGRGRRKMSGRFQLLTPSRRVEVDTADTDAKSAPHLLSVDLHQVLGKITTSQVQEKAGARLRAI